jgi:hypothetical protein
LEGPKEIQWAIRGYRFIGDVRGFVDDARERGFKPPGVRRKVWRRIYLIKELSTGHLD